MPLDAMIGSPMRDFDSKQVDVVPIPAKKQSDQKAKMTLLVSTQQSDQQWKETQQSPEIRKEEKG
eukprot:12655986-Ditylum_brightwellii.AAC.1